MSIAAANLWTRNIYKEYLNKDATPKQEARSSKIASLVVKFGALVAILALDPQFSIDLQLIGGVVMLQTLPAVALLAVHPLVPQQGAHRRLGRRHGGRASGRCTRSRRSPSAPTAPVTVTKEHFGGSAFPLSELGFDTQHDDLRGHRSPSPPTCSSRPSARCCCAVGWPTARTPRARSHYTAEAGDPGVKDLTQLMH